MNHVRACFSFYIIKVQYFTSSSTLMPLTLRPMYDIFEVSTELIQNLFDFAPTSLQDTNGSFFEETSSPVVVKRSIVTILHFAPYAHQLLISMYLSQQPQIQIDRICKVVRLVSKKTSATKGLFLNRFSPGHNKYL